MIHESGWYLEAGESYRFYATEETPLKDCSIHSPGMEGFSSSYPRSWITRLLLKYTESFRRRRYNNWFALVGGIKIDGESTKDIDARSDLFFLMTEETELKVKISGEFVCFVNDIKLMYFNNKGTISIRIQKI